MRINLVKNFNKKASANIYVTLIAIGVVIVVFTLFIAGIQDVNVSYDSSVQKSHDQGIKISETLINDCGRNDIGNEWYQTDLPVKKLGFKDSEKYVVFTINSTTGDYNTKFFEYGGLPFLYSAGTQKDIAGKWDLPDPDTGYIDCCFLKDTKVLMGNGKYKNIEEIRVGDIVTAFDEKLKTKVNRKVTDVFHHSYNEMGNYYMIINDFLKVTPNHPMYINGKWDKIGNAVLGDELGCKDSLVSITKIDYIFAKVPTYNIEVEKNHNYHVLLSGKNILVHNKQRQYGKYDDGESCFLKGTKVLMADGFYKNIENIKMGDRVVSFDSEKQKREIGFVSYVFHHKPEEMSSYYIVINDFLRVTPNHPMYSDEGWKEAGNLRIGDYLGSNDNYKIVSLEKIYKRVPTYNFEVQPYHNYIVATAEEDLVVHNDVLIGYMDGGEGEDSGLNSGLSEEDTIAFNPFNGNDGSETNDKISGVACNFPLRIGSSSSGGGGLNYWGSSGTSFHGSESLLDIMEESDIVNYGTIDYAKLNATTNLNQSKVLEILGLDDAVELKYGSDIHITVKNTLTKELIWEYPEDDFDSTKEYNTLFQRRLTMYQEENTDDDLYVPVTFTLQIHQSNV